MSNQQEFKNSLTIPFHGSSLNQENQRYQHAMAPGRQQKHLDTTNNNLVKQYNA